MEKCFKKAEANTKRKSYECSGNDRKFNRERQIKEIMRNVQGKKIALWGMGR